MFGINRTVLKDCKIYQMLVTHAKKRHLSFHTPGHKIGKWDITELSFSDNLSAPHGCIAEAEKDIAKILGAYKSFILTDGSTSGVLSMLYAAKSIGVKYLAVFEKSHKSLFNGCKLLGITPLVFSDKKIGFTPNAPTMSELKTEYPWILEKADAIFITSPDYYGNVADLSALRTYCDETGKLLLVDGAHGGHLHFNKELYAGAYADLWTDGVHKNLPALTQGAVVSVKKEEYARALLEGVNIFRTTSPSYPIMASVEYAVKYPRNKQLEEEALAYIRSCERMYASSDWTKICALFGENAFDADEELRKKGIYSEFCDGNIVMFYLSPATSNRQFDKLKVELQKLFEKYPYLPKKQKTAETVKNVSCENKPKKWVDIKDTVGKVCAGDCGFFPPCTPLIQEGEIITKEKIDLLTKAANVYGVIDGKILVLIEEKKRWRL